MERTVSIADAVRVRPMDFCDIRRELGAGGVRKSICRPVPGIRGGPWYGRRVRIRGRAVRRRGTRSSEYCGRGGVPPEGDWNRAAGRGFTGREGGIRDDGISRSASVEFRRR
jgi:hypothetical protein